MTTLRDALNDIRHKRLGAISNGYYASHTELSKVLPRLSRLEQQVDRPSRSRFDAVADKVVECVASRSCSVLERSDWRVVPWVMWTGECVAEQDWFLDELFRIISAQRPKSVIRALIHAYVFHFDPSKVSIKRVAGFLLRDALQKGERLGDRWLAVNSRCSIFVPSDAPRRVSELILEAETFAGGLENVGISTEQVDGGLARAAFAYAYMAVAKNLKNVADQAEARRAIEQLLVWATGDGGQFRYQSSFASMATTLLEALAASNVAGETQDRIVRYFVDKFGDPRLNPARWHGVTQSALDVALRILIRATLEDFTRVIDATADARHWKERKPFWLQYYEMGALEDAWVAFGPKAVSVARRFEHAYARLDNASDTAHSALILRIANLIIVEWSHNGRCRFFPIGRGIWAPELYASRYDFLLLHRQSSITGDYLSHMSNWQHRFAHRIFQGTNVRHPRFGSGWS